MRSRVSVSDRRMCGHDVRLRCRGEIDHARGLAFGLWIRGKGWFEVRNRRIVVVVGHDDDEQDAMWMRWEGK